MENTPNAVAAPFIVWKDDFTVGSKMLDGEHQRIIALINQLYDAIQSHHPEKVIGAVLDGLLDYTRTHFSDEEAMMTEAVYPDIEAHRGLHRQMVQHTTHLVGQHRLKHGDISSDVLSFLKRWWVGHICREDRAYRAFVSKLGR